MRSSFSKISSDAMTKKTKNYQLIKDLKINFDDVAGMKRPKQELSEFVEFLKDDSKFNNLGAVMPKGALMTGPPGVGKTYLAKAVAGEAGVSFFYVSGSEFVEKYVGVGASRVRELFKQAKKKSPALIFIDEIDAVAQKRNENFGNTEGMNTLNQLLVEMDGFDTDQQVVVIGSTNLKEVLDPAILRPGRFDRLIEIGYPELEEREEIFEIYLKKVILDTSENKTIDFYKQKLATLTPGFTGADISNIVNEVISN
jgi:ATP-dependent metalloprotease FtsH